MELMIEKMGLDIIPVKGLDKIEAFLSINTKCIRVNHNTYMDERYESRLRFSFAHEIGHFSLHRNIISKMRFDSADEYHDFIINFPENEYSRFEYQANEFGGRLLVPYERLKDEVNKIHDTIINKKLTKLLKEYPEQMLASVCPMLCKPFGVSEQVVKIRVEREALWPVQAV